VSSGKKNSDTKPALRPDDTYTTIYQLTKIIVHKLCGNKNISIPITPALCSHIAVMMSRSFPHSLLVYLLIVVSQVQMACQEGLEHCQHQENQDPQLLGAH
jgi:hypothetical protein